MPGGVIAAVLELAQALEEDLLDGAIPDVSHDPAHEEAILERRPSVLPDVGDRK